MMEYLSSMYIDDEMSMDEKIKFIEKIHDDDMFYKQTLDLLDQEQMISQLPDLPEDISGKRWESPVLPNIFRFFKPLAFAASGFAAAAILLFYLYPSTGQSVYTDRFVLFEPSAHQVELVGSFTQWKRIPMKRLGNSGYWELILPVSSGENRFAYILDNTLQIADPTMPLREKDDFGGENSILLVGENT